MAAGDTALWLHNKLGSTDDLWSGKTICSQLSQERLQNIHACFHTLQPHVKVKLMLSFLHIPRRNVDLLYSQKGVGLLSNVEDDLKCALKSKIDAEEGVDVDIINCAKASDIQTDIPLLILCIQVSRLGTAVASTVQGMTLTPKMAVVIFHHKDVHALPNQASERVLTGQELRNLGGIFDLAFLSGKGIYPCDMNDSNFVSLVNFIKREGKKRLKEDI